MWVGDWVVVELVRGVKGRDKGDAKICFLAGQAVYVHYFKDIRQGALRAGTVSGDTPVNC